MSVPPFRRAPIRRLSSVVCLWLAAAAPGLGCAESPAGAKAASERSPADPTQPLHVVQEEVRRAIRADFQAKNTFDERVVTAWRLIQLHQRIVTDSRFPTSDTLKGLRDQLAARLLVVQADIKRQIHRERVATSRGSAHRPNSKAPPAGANTTPDKPGIAAGPTPDELVDSLSDHLTLVGSTAGGPARLLAYGNPAEGRGGGGIGPPDNGPALVDLIQKTIHPESWDVNGGHGTILYFYPLRCLVVRATRDVHGEMGDLVQGLRGAGP